jgi:hypothetical protein
MSNEQWHVLLGNGEVCRMSLGMLDEAFEDGVVHEGTFICREGTDDWISLREAAHLDEPEDPAMARQLSRPVIAADAAVLFYEARYGAAGPASTAPVAMLSDSDLLPPPPKRSPLRWIAGVALVACFGLGAIKLGEHTAPPPRGSSAASMRAASPVSEASKPPVPAPVPPPPTPPWPAKAETPKDSPSNPSALSEETKRALLEADKARAAKVQQKVKQKQAKVHGVASSPKSVMGGEKVFSKGGSARDPLNASL